METSITKDSPEPTTANQFYGCTVSDERASALIYFSPAFSKPLDLRTAFLALTNYGSSLQSLPSNLRVRRACQASRVHYHNYGERFILQSEPLPSHETKIPLVITLPQIGRISKAARLADALERTGSPNDDDGDSNFRKTPLSTPKLLFQIYFLQPLLLTVSAIISTMKGSMTLVLIGRPASAGGPTDS